MTDYIKTLVIIVQLKYLSYCNFPDYYMTFLTSNNNVQPAKSIMIKNKKEIGSDTYSIYTCYFINHMWV